MKWGFSIKVLLICIDHFDGQYTPVAESENPFAGVNVVETNQLAFEDIDGDLDVDVLAIEGNGEITYYENVSEGNNSNPEPEPNPNPNPNPDSLLNIPINRFQNTDVSGTYLYVGEAESAVIRESLPNFEEEGFAFKVAAQSNDDLIP